MLRIWYRLCVLFCESTHHRRYTAQSFIYIHALQPQFLILSICADFRCLSIEPNQFWVIIPVLVVRHANGKVIRKLLIEYFCVSFRRDRFPLPPRFRRFATYQLAVQSTFPSSASGSFTNTAIGSLYISASMPISSLRFVIFVKMSSTTVREMYG